MKPAPRVPEIIAPKPLCIAVRRALKVQTRTLIRYPIDKAGWHYQLEKVLL